MLPVNDSIERILRYEDELAKSKGVVASLEEVMFRDGCEIIP